MRLQKATEQETNMIYFLQDLSLLTEQKHEQLYTVCSIQSFSAVAFLTNQIRSRKKDNYARGDYERREMKSRQYCM